MNTDDFSTLSGSACPRRCTTALLTTLALLAPEFLLFAQGQPRITQTTRTGSVVRLEWAGPAGTYEVQTRSSLTDARWRPAFITERFKAEFNAEAGTQFYRVITPPTLKPDSAVTEAVRLRVIDAVNQKIGALKGEDDHADSQALLAYVGQHPEFNDSGVTPDSSVWARFNDGRLLLILNNRPPGVKPALADLRMPTRLPDGITPIPASPSPSVDGGPREIPPPGPPEPMDIASARPTALPDSRNAVLLRATLPGIEAPILNHLVPAFGNRQYHLVGGEASLPQLKNVRNLGGDVGVFYIDSHGGLAVSRSITTNATTGDRIIVDDTVFAVASSTAVTPATEPLYEADFRNGEVCYAVVGPKGLKNLRRTEGGSATFPPFYCVLPPFVSKYWKFGRNSMVYIDTCHGGSAGASAFIEACIANGAGNYFGWSNVVDDDGAQQTTQVLFDTLLGAGQILDVNPAQRSFDRWAVLEYLERSGFDTDLKYGAKLKGWERGDTGSDFGLLTPSIYSMNVDESKEELRIVGLFDTEAATTVRVVGAGGPLELPATVRRIASSGLSLHPTEVVCHLPARQQPSAGEVTVIQRGRQSNTVPLTEWWVQATGEKYFAVGQPQPSARMTFHLHFRADVHPSRAKPYEAPLFRGASASAASDSSSRVVSASGFYFYPDGSGNVTWTLPKPVDLGITYVGFNQVDSAFFGSMVLSGNGNGNLTLIAKAKDAMKVTQTLNNVQNSYQTDPGTRTFPPGQLKYNPETFRFESGSGPAASDSGVFHWEASTPTYAPVRSAPGYAE